MEKNNKAKQKALFPTKQMKYIQSVDEMKLLIPYLIERMSSCPRDDISFNLIEKVDYYGLVRNFKLKSKNTQNNNDTINKFKDNLLADITCLDSFIVIPTTNSVEIETQSNKGNQFKAPKVFDINGDEATLGASSSEIYLFFFDNLTDLSAFVSKNKNTNQMVFCLCINMSFFETKKWIKNSGCLNNRNFYFYFTGKSSKDINLNTNLKLVNLPRVAIISNGIIREDKCIKNINSFDINRDLVNIMSQKGYNNEEQEKVDKFINMENENKRKVVKSMNIYLKNNGFNDVHFYVRSKIKLDKIGIKKIRCYPIIYGEANISGKNLIDNLIDILNGQQLFHEIQCNVKYNN